MYRKSLLRKGFALGIILLFMVASIIPSFAQNVKEKQPLLTSRGNCLYVGGSGPENYSRIQDAIDNASDGDTVFVYRGTYHEHVDVDKAIYLLGEDRNTTIIDGDYSQRIIYITANNTQISSFTIQHSGAGWEGIEITSNSNSNTVSGNTFLHNSFGLVVYRSNHTLIERNNFIQNDLSLELQYGNHSTVTGNIIQSGRDSIYLPMSTGNIITENILQNNEEGIYLHESNHTLVSNNIINTINDSGIVIEGDDNTVISNIIHACNKTGISVEDSSSNVIQENSVEYNYWGIYLLNASDTTVFQNRVTNNSVGILLLSSKSNQISFNTFISNNLSAFFKNGRNIWKQNYWNKPRVLPKPIFGGITISLNKKGRLLFIPLFQFDWHPAQKPFEIGR